MASKVSSTYPSFFNNDGTPLEDGSIYIGEENKNAKTNLINIFWDSALTIPASQPLKTIGGYIVRNGTPSVLYVNEDYSIYVEDKNETFLYSELKVVQEADSEQVAENTNAIAINTRNRLSIVITPTTDTDYILTTEENQYGRIEINTTNWTTARNAIMDNSEHTFLAVASGGQDVTFKNSSGTGILVLDGEAKELRNDTTNVINYEDNPDIRLNTADEEYAGQIAGEKILKQDGSNIASQATAIANVIGTDIVPTVNNILNIDDVTTSANGRFIIEFSEDMDTTDYVPLLSVEGTTGGTRFVIPRILSKSVSSFEILMENTGGTDTDGVFNLAVFGGKN